MTSATEITWSDTEKEIAQEAFNRAYDREIHALMEDVRIKTCLVTELNDLWGLHDFLSARRHQIDGKYDYQYSKLIFIFAQLLKEGWLYLNDIEGLAKDKLAKISVLSRM